MNLEFRLRRLEQHRRVDAGARPCADCGGPREWRHCRPGPGEVKIRVLGGRENAPEDPGVPDVCPGCGRRLVIRVEHDRGG